MFISCDDHQLSLSLLIFYSHHLIRFSHSILEAIEVMVATIFVLAVTILVIADNHCGFFWCQIAWLVS